jgi:hypothetical protein
MIRHLNPCKRIGYRRNVFVIQTEEILVVISLSKQIAAIYSTIVNMEVIPKGY